jgi:2-dehydro-3-deoxyphosphogalactonate aldolase
MAGAIAGGHLRALKAVLPPEVTVIPVGGVGPVQMADWWAAGARGFGLGSEVYRVGMSADEVGVRAVAAVAALTAARGS